MQTDQRLFSETVLAEYNGVSGRPTYLAVRQTRVDLGASWLMTLHLQIDGDVYDVSKGKSYQPGGSYHFMSVRPFSADRLVA